MAPNSATQVAHITKQRNDQLTARHPTLKDHLVEDMSQAVVWMVSLLYSYILLVAAKENGKVFQPSYASSALGHRSLDGDSEAGKRHTMPHAPGRIPEESLNTSKDKKSKDKDKVCLIFEWGYCYFDEIIKMFSLNESYKYV